MSGIVTIFVKGLNLDKFINAVVKDEVPLIEIIKVSPRVIRIKTTIHGYEIIKNHKISRFYTIRLKHVWGVKQKLLQVLKYSGVMAGIILSFLLFFLSTRVVTNVVLVKDEKHICGNGSKCIFEDSNQKELCMYLKAIGVENGKNMNSIIPSSIERQIVAKFESVSSCTVTKSGTKVWVELHEGQVESSDEKGLDIIAPENAKILSMKVSSGEPQVKAGDVVTKGTILVKGVNGQKAMATINMNLYLVSNKLYFENQIELEDTGNKIVESYFSVLGKDVLKKNLSISQNLYRIECETKDLTRGLFVPVRLVIVTYYEQKPVEKCISIQEKRDELQSELQTQVKKIAQMYGENISYKFIETDMGGGCYLLDCYAELVYIMDIK